MRMEGCDERLVKVMFPEEAGGAKVEEAKADTVEESDADKEALKKYRTMRKMNVPEQAVLHKMRMEGCDERLVKIMFPDAAGGGGVKSKALPLPPARALKATTKSAKKKGRTTGTGCALMNLHWTPLSKDAVANSVWGKVSSTREGGGALSPASTMVGGAVEKNDIISLEVLFHKKSGAQKAAGSGAPDPAGTPAKKKQKKLAGLIDMTRANNVAISLKAFKEFTFEEVRARSLLQYKLLASLFASTILT